MAGLLSLVGACSEATVVAEPEAASGSTSSEDRPNTPTSAPSEFPPRPPTPTGALDPAVQEVLDRAWSAYPNPDDADLRALGESGDARLAWLLTDYLRFNVTNDAVDPMRSAVTELTGLEFDSNLDWVGVVDTLMGWELPAFPGYLDYKRIVFAFADERWEPFFTSESDIDYRWWTWGGVLIDDSPPGEPGTCRGCIPGLDDPQVTTAEDGDWYPDERPVMGVVINGEARAYPRNIMEVHEMVNDTLGGRDFAMPYCTLCGSAQLYFTDDLGPGFERPFLRTSGLLSRSNKVMYDVVTGSVFDTFTGSALSGPLWEEGVTLNQGTVITTTWAEWKEEYPETTIVELEGGAGRVYQLDPLGDRDAAGPIFPIGQVDDRLHVHEAILGVVLEDGTALAFPVAQAREVLEGGDPVELAGVEVALDAGGVRATYRGEPIASHQAFWFAWSQFHPDTLLWQP